MGKNVLRNFLKPNSTFRQNGRCFGAGEHRGDGGLGRRGPPPLEGQSQEEEGQGFRRRQPKTTKSQRRIRFHRDLERDRRRPRGTWTSEIDRRLDLVRYRNSRGGARRRYSR